MKTTTFANGQQIHCPVCSKHLWLEAVVYESGVVTTRLTDASLAHMRQHAERKACECQYVPDVDVYVAPFGYECTVHHGYECAWCKLPTTYPHAHAYSRKVAA